MNTRSLLHSLTATLIGSVALCGSATAEPVDVSQAGATIGSGFGFRRGDTCTVVTALHVVENDALEISVADRSGARVTGQRAYANSAYDVALVTLPRGTIISCTARWPDTSWIRGAVFSSGSQFEVIRHYPTGGRETIILMRFVGKTDSTLTLAPLDRMSIRESDSGSIVIFEGRQVGIVQRVDPTTDRVEMLRFDVLDQLVGNRFRGFGQLRRVALEGIFRGGRSVQDWSAYARAWLQETGKVLVVDANERQPSCRLRGDVLHWQAAREPNPEYSRLQERLRTCSSVPVLGRTLCNQVRDQMRNTTPQLSGYRVTLDVAVTRPSGQRSTKLATATHLSPSPRMDRESAERAALEEAFRAAIHPLFEEGACD